MPDFVAEFVALVREHAPGVDAAAEMSIETAIRSRFGGREVRIDRQAPAARPTMGDIDDRLRQRKPVTAIAAELGVSRATIYRMLNAGRGKSRRA